MTVPPVFNVVISFNLAYQTNAAMLGGIMSYVKTCTPWNITLFTGRIDEQKLLNTSEVNGVFLDFSDGKLPSWMNRIGLGRIPVVFVANTRCVLALGSERITKAFRCSLPANHLRIGLMRLFNPFSLLHFIIDRFCVRNSLLFN